MRGLVVRTMDAARSSVIPAFREPRATPDPSIESNHGYLGPLMISAHQPASITSIENIRAMGSSTRAKLWNLSPAWTREGAE